MKEEKAYLTILEFAHEISAHPNTVRKMIKSGRISAFKLDGGRKSAYRIARSEITRMAVVDLEKIVNDMVEKRLKEKK